MIDKEAKVTVRYKSVGKEKKFEVQKIKSHSKGRPSRKAYDYDIREINEGTYEFDLPIQEGEKNYISLMPSPDDLTSACKIGIPADRPYNYEVIPGDGETIDVERVNGRTYYKIPQDNSRWKLVLTGLPGAVSIDSGTNEPVTVEEDEDGNTPDTYLLTKLKRSLGNCRPLKDFLDEMKEEEARTFSIGRLNHRKLKIRKLIIDQARELFEQVYVHLPLKKAMHIAGPIQRIRLLELRAAEVDDKGKFLLSDRAFHNRMISIFTELRDLHTLYLLPSPYRDKIAFLPFLIEEFYDETSAETAAGEDTVNKERTIRKKKISRKYMVSKIFNGARVKEKSFKRGVIITHWNGVPIETAVAMNGERNAGNNKYARHARGLERMTIRPLKMAFPPDEQWIDITFKNDENDEPQTVRFNWYVAGEPERKIGAMESPNDTVQAALGIDIETEMVSKTKKALFFDGKHPSNEELSTEEKAKNLCKFEIREIKAADLDPENYTGKKALKFGYFRIYSFNVNDPDYFVNLFTQTIKPKLKNTEGLIIDVRGNGGGLITAGERLLQVFTPKLGSSYKPDRRERPIVPESFQFINTPLMLRLCQNDQKMDENDKVGRLGLLRWEESIKRSIETGAIYSQGFPLENYRFEGERYDGPVILITDALCYSTTDIFAAGFKDNHIGLVLGVHNKTGAGGANVWDYGLLHELLYGELSNLPHPDFKGCDWNFRVAIRRSIRVGDNIGMPLEDLGVEPDCIHYMSRNDLLEINADLIKKAAKILLNPNKCKDGKYINGSEDYELIVDDMYPEE